MICFFLLSYLFFLRHLFPKYFFFFFLYRLLKSSLSSQFLPLNYLFISNVSYCRIHLPKPTQLLVISPSYHLHAVPFMASSACSSHFSYSYLPFKAWFTCMLCFCFLLPAHLSYLTLFQASELQAKRFVGK